MQLLSGMPTSPRSTLRTIIVRDARFKRSRSKPWAVQSQCNAIPLQGHPCCLPPQRCLLRQFVSPAICGAVPLPARQGYCRRGLHTARRDSGCIRGTGQPFPDFPQEAYSHCRICRGQYLCRPCDRLLSSSLVLSAHWFVFVPVE
jgi:hypothetical protein